LPPANSGIEVADKLISKHAVETGEVEEALTARPRFGLLRRGIERAKMCIWPWGRPIREDTWL